jgi:hypothetical protein
MHGKNSLMRHGTGQIVGVPPLNLTSPSVVRFSVGMTEGWGIGGKLGRSAVHRGWQGELEASGAEARCFSSPNRRHKCLLHPVTLE